MLHFELTLCHFKLIDLFFLFLFVVVKSACLFAANYSEINISSIAAGHVSVIYYATNSVTRAFQTHIIQQTLKLIK